MKVSTSKVVDVVVRNSEIPPEDTQEKAEKLDVNCMIDDGSQVGLEMQASRIEEVSDGRAYTMSAISIPPSHPRDCGDMISWPRPFM